MEVKGVRGKFEFEDEHLDYHNGQNEFRAVAWLPNAEGTQANAVAQIHYSTYNGIAHIEFVETNPTVRGQGLATTLYALVALANPNTPIDDGLLTDDGAKWRNSKEVHDLMDWAKSVTPTQVTKGGEGSGRFPKGSHTELHPALPYGKEGSLEGAKATPEQVVKVLSSPEALSELNLLLTGSRTIQNTPLVGGCLLTAKALNIIFPNAELKASITTSIPHIESALGHGRTPLIDHFALSIGNDEYLDGRGVVTEPHVIDLSRSLMGVEPRPMSNGLYENHLVEATPKVIDDAKGYMSCPDGAPEQFAQYILDHIVSKGGQGSGRYPKGSQHFTGTITPITSEEELFDAQGKVLSEARAKGLNLGTDNEPDDPDQHELWLGYRMTYAALSIGELENYDDPDAPVSVLVAKNNDGTIVGATMFQPIDKNIFIHYIGSTQTESGVGKALLSEIAKVAGSQNKGIDFEPELTSVGFWEHEGFEIRTINPYSEMPVYTMPANQVHTLIQ